MKIATLSIGDYYWQWKRENYQLNGKIIYVENNSTSQIVKFKLNHSLCMEPDGQCVAALKKERERESTSE